MSGQDRVRVRTSSAGEELSAAVGVWCRQETIDWNGLEGCELLITPAPNNYSSIDAMKPGLGDSKARLHGSVELVEQWAVSPLLHQCQAGQAATMVRLTRRFSQAFWLEPESIIWTVTVLAELCAPAARSTGVPETVMEPTPVAGEVTPTALPLTE